MMGSKHIYSKADNIQCWSWQRKQNSWCDEKWYLGLGKHLIVWLVCIYQEKQMHMLLKIPSLGEAWTMSIPSWWGPNNKPKYSEHSSPLSLLDLLTKRRQGVACRNMGDPETAEQYSSPLAWMMASLQINRGSPFSSSSQPIYSRPSLKPQGCTQWVQDCIEWPEVTGSFPLGGVVNSLICNGLRQVGPADLMKVVAIWLRR